MPEFKKDRSKFRMKSWDTFINDPNETPFKFGFVKSLRKGWWSSLESYGRWWRC